MEKNQRSEISKAWDIYRAGYRNSFISRDIPESKKFFLSLRKAVINELESTGFCELLDALIENRMASIDIVVYAVFADIASGYKMNKLADVESNQNYSEYIPYVKTAKALCCRWEEAKTLNYYRLPMSESVLEKLYIARQTIRNVHAQHITAHNDAGSDEVQIKTSNESEGILEKAKAEAKVIIEDAKKEAGRINESAQNAAKTIVENATEQAKKESSKSASILLTQYVADEQKRYKRELNDEMVSFSQSILEGSKRAATTHAEMCNSTNAFQAEWVRALDDALEHLNSVKAEFYTHLHNWQVSLYPSEIRPLAERYLELYRIINVDKLLREEVVFRNSTEQLDEASNGAEIGEENSSGVDTVQDEVVSPFKEKAPLDSTICGLQKLNKTLSTFLRRFEASLNGLDLYVYYPKEGDIFDELWHVPEDEEIECSGKVIAEFLVPGIAKKANDNHGDDVLIPAVVRVAMEN